MSDAASILILLANLGVLGLNLKLYTEILKDHSQNRRAVRSKGEQLSAPAEQEKKQ